MNSKHPFSPPHEIEDFSISEDPLTGFKLDPPSQLELKPKVKGHFTREASKLIRRHGGKAK